MPTLIASEQTSTYPLKSEPVLIGAYVPCLCAMDFVRQLLKNLVLIQQQRVYIEVATSVVPAVAVPVLAST